MKYHTSFVNYFPALFTLGMAIPNPLVCPRPPSSVLFFLYYTTGSYVSLQYLSFLSCTGPFYKLWLRWSRFLSLVFSFKTGVRQCVVRACSELVHRLRRARIYPPTIIGLCRHAPPPVRGVRQCVVYVRVASTSFIACAGLGSNHPKSFLAIIFIFIFGHYRWPGITFQDKVLVYMCFLVNKTQ